MKKLLLILLCLPFIGFGNNWSFKLGGNMLLPFSKTFFDETNTITSRLGYSAEILYLYNINKKNSYVSSIIFNNVAYNTQVTAGLTSNPAIMQNFVNYAYSTTDFKNSISITQQGAYHFDNKMTMFMGCSFTKLLESTSAKSLIFISYLYSINYSITSIKEYPIFIFSNIKLPFHYLGYIYKSAVPFNLHFDRNLTFGLGIDL